MDIIDESHFYKNLYLYTKMRNVGGIAQTEAQKSSDLFMKCRYLDELTGGRGVVFATGTPISNTMVELYTMQKYLQYETLRRNGLLHFDAWASTFGETVTAIELAPDRYYQDRYDNRDDYYQQENQKNNRRKKRKNKRKVIFAVEVLVLLVLAVVLFGALDRKSVV